MNFGQGVPVHGSQSGDKFSANNPSENLPEVEAADVSFFEIQNYFPHAIMPAAESPWDEDQSEFGELFSYPEFAIDGCEAAQSSPTFQSKSGQASGTLHSQQSASKVYRVLKPTKFLFNSKVVSSKSTQLKTGVWKVVGRNCLVMADSQDSCLRDAEEDSDRAEDRQIDEVPVKLQADSLQGLKKKSRRESVETMITSEDIVAPPSSSRFIDCVMLH